MADEPAESGSRVGFLCVAGGRSLFLDDQESVVREGDSFDPAVFVAREDDEVRRVGADGLVLLAARLDPLS